MTIALFLAGGIVLLFAGGESLVRGAVLLATRLGVSPLLIGLTIVGFGTSTPELVTSVQATLAGSPGIALGNIVGSNIANVLLILALAALIAPVPCPARTVYRDGGLMLGSAVLLTALCFGGNLGRFEGSVLIAGLAGYLTLLIWQEGAAVPLSAAEPVPARSYGAGPVLKELAFLAAGLGMVVIGARLLVTGAMDLAEAAGVEETVIGLTVVAVGTSLPELATSLVAAWRNHTDIAYGNIVGSSIFNLLGIAGTTALVAPVAVPASIVAFDLPVVIAISVMMTIFAATGRRLSRREGGILLGCYALYVALLIV